MWTCEALFLYWSLNICKTIIFLIQLSYFNVVRTKSNYKDATQRWNMYDILYKYTVHVAFRTIITSKGTVTISNWNSEWITAGDHHQVRIQDLLKGGRSPTRRVKEGSPEQCEGRRPEAPAGMDVDLVHDWEGGGRQKLSDRGGGVGGGIPLPYQGGFAF